MKRLFTFLFVVSVLSATVWAADWATTYSENYADATKAGVSGSLKSYTRKNYPNLTWSYKKVRIKSDTLPLGEQAIWFNRNVTDFDDADPCFFECANLEGGIKNISFLYKQANSGDDGKIICLAVKSNDVRIDSIRFTGAKKYRNASQTYNNALGIKSNSKFSLQNISHAADADYSIIPGRIIISAITVTPYLLYRNKDVTIGTKQYGYVNKELLDNTGGTETITYKSSNDAIATIDSETGIVTPVSAGNVIISASLDGGITTITDYMLHVVDNIVAENFSKVVQTGSAASGTSWDGDIFGWTVNKVRRFTNDTIYQNPRVQGTWIAENDGNLQSKSAVEGGIKNLTFDWMQWTNVTSTTIKVLYGGVEKIVDAQTDISQFNHFTIDEDINGTSNAVLKISNSSPSSPQNRITIGTIKITPYLLYTTKSVTIARGDGKYTNHDLIDNTSGEVGTLSYSSSDEKVATIDENGEVTPLAKGVTTITATFSWEGSSVTTSYTLNIVGVVELTEDYSNAIKQGQKNEPITYDGNYYSWTYRKVRINSDKVNGEQAIWMSRYWNGSANEKNCYIETASAEGGIKNISFNWQQANAGDDAKILCLDVKIAGTRVDGIEEEGREELRTTYQTYSKDLQVKTNAKLMLHNTSHIAGSSDIANGRLLVGPIHITPYIFYSDKQASVAVGNTYLHPIIDNTEGEGSISYALDPSDSDKATINASTGEVETTAEGEVTVTATWSEGASTTYTLKVLPSTNCETFSNESTASTYASNEEQAEGDQCTWTARLGGINSGDFYPYAAFIRAPRQNENKEAYLQSSVLTGGITSMTFDWNLVAGESTTTWDIRVLINGREVKRIVNSDLAAASDKKMKNFEQITISGINEPGNFTIRFENHSTVSGTYTSGNKARFVIDNIVWTNYEGTKTLGENTYNDGWISSNNGETHTVIISRSAMVANVYNTICLPFAISKADDLDDADVQEMTSASIDGDVLTIGFSALDGDELQAGKPYLVKPTSNKDISGTYSSKQISSIASPVTFGSVTLQGIFSPTLLKANDYSTLFVGTPDGEGNNLFYPSEDASLNGFRAYFKINEAMGAPIRHARFVTDQTNTATVVDSEKSIVESRKTIENGQLIIIRDGVRYDVLGRKK